MLEIYYQSVLAASMTVMTQLNSCLATVVSQEDAADMGGAWLPELDRLDALCNFVVCLRCR